MPTLKTYGQLTTAFVSRINSSPGGWPKRSSFFSSLRTDFGITGTEHEWAALQAGKPVKLGLAVGAAGYFAKRWGVPVPPDAYLTVTPPTPPDRDTGSDPWWMLLLDVVAWAAGGSVVLVAAAAVQAVRGEPWVGVAPYLFLLLAVSLSHLSLSRKAARAAEECEMRAMEIAEDVTALAVAELIELFDVPAEKRAALMQRIRAPVLSAVMSYAAMSCPKRVLRRKYLDLRPSAN